MESIIWVSLYLGILPFLGFLLWWWNDLWYGFRAKIRLSAGKDVKLPPGHMGLPILGEMSKFLWYFKFLGRPDDFINSKRNKYGHEIGMYRSYLFRKPVIIATSPAFCKFVLQKETSFMLEWPTIELFGNYSLTASQGPQHRRLKVFITRCVNHPDALRITAPLIQPRIIATLESWSQKGQIYADKESEKMTFEIIAKFMVNFEPGPVLDALHVDYDIMVHGYRANPIKLPGTAYHRALQSRKKIEAIFKEELEKRKTLKNGDNDTLEVKDILDGMMQFKDDEGKHLTDTEVIHNTMNLIQGGHKSTSLSSMWAIYYLAKYPHVLHKLREENISLSKSKKGEFVTSDDIKNLKYTNKVVEEIVRLTNVATFIFRTAKQDVEYQGYMIPKGWSVMLWLRYLHTNPENFEDPMTFNPDRWNEPPMPGTYLVYGGGSRTCAGNMLARLQIAIFIHYLVVGYKWELINPNAKWTYLPFQKPNDGVEIFIERYSHA